MISSFSQVFSSQKPYEQGVAPSFANQVNDFEHRYVIFLDGINSSASSDDEKPLQNRFGIIQEELERRGLSKFVYFSYSAASYRNTRFCEGWGPNGCVPGSFGELSSLHLYPEYAEEDTELSIDLQAAALNWLIGEIVRIDPQAEIDLVGFSLGGIVSSYWASQTHLFDRSNHTNKIILINSPVGGIPGAEAVLDGCGFDIGIGEIFVCNIWRSALISMYGKTVLGQLQLPVDNEATSIVDDMPKAVDKFSMTSIQSSDDYMVNDQTLPICNGLTCDGHDDMLVGIGSQYWIGITNLHDLPLGGRGLAEEPVGKIEMVRILRENHNAALGFEQTAIWVGDALTQVVEVPIIDQLNAKALGFTYDIVTPGETANLIFQVQNTGSLPWEGVEFEFAPSSTSEFGDLQTYSIYDVFDPGEIAIWELQIPNVSGGTIKTVEYQMLLNKEPFGNVIPGYIFILPEGIKDIELQLKEKIDEWVARGEQEFQDLLELISQEIQKAIQEQTQNAIDNLLSQCQSSVGLFIGVVLIYIMRNKQL